MKLLEKNGAPGEIRTPDLLVRSPFKAYTRYNSEQLNPNKSAKLSRFRCFLSFAFVPRSCTVRAQLPKLRV